MTGQFLENPSMNPEPEITEPVEPNAKGDFVDAPHRRELINFIFGDETKTLDCEYGESTILFITEDSITYGCNDSGDHHETERGTVTCPEGYKIESIEHTPYGASEPVVLGLGTHYNITFDYDVTVNIVVSDPTYKINKSTLIGIADAVRSKTGSTDQIAVAELGNEIHGIQLGITPTGTKTITENGTVDVTEFASAEVNVASVKEVSTMPEPSEENEGMIYLYEGETTEEFEKGGLYMVEPLVKIISFIIDDDIVGAWFTTYQAEEGMNFYQWCNSTYNNGGFVCDLPTSTVYSSTMESLKQYSPFDLPAVTGDRGIANGDHYTRTFQPPIPDVEAQS